MERKELLKSNDALLDKLESVGIKFDIYSREDAIDLLEKKNYYFKLSSYRINFPKKDNKYDIDFAHLVDFSVIDMTVRYYLLKISLDMEHGIKTVFMNEITNNPTVDGYNFIETFKEKYPSFYNSTIKSLENNDYLQDIYDRHHDNIPIWVFIECCGFGTLIKMVELYQQLYNSQILRPADNLMRYARHVRNACAHSNVLLINVYKRRYRLKASASVVSHAERLGLPTESISYRKNHDIFCLVALHEKYCSEALKKRRKQELQEITTRITQNESYYALYPNVHKIFKNLLKILEKIG